MVVVCPVLSCPVLSCTVLYMPSYGTIQYNIRYDTTAPTVQVTVLSTFVESDAFLLRIVSTVDYGQGAVDGAGEWSGRKRSASVRNFPIERSHIDIYDSEISSLHALLW